MIQEPMERAILSCAKLACLNNLKEIITDRPLMDKIEALAGSGFSLKTLFNRLLRAGNFDFSSAERLRREIARRYPEALTQFAELVDICKKLARYENPLIVY